MSCHFGAVDAFCCAANNAMIVASIPGDTELPAEKSGKKPATDWLAVHQAERSLDTTVDPELLYLEDMSVGDRWLSQWREISCTVSSPSFEIRTL